MTNKAKNKQDIIRIQAKLQKALYLRVSLELVRLGKSWQDFLVEACSQFVKHKKGE